jgi:hypothetical protein
VESSQEGNNIADKVNTEIIGMIFDFIRFRFSYISQIKNHAKLLTLNPDCI